VTLDRTWLASAVTASADRRVNGLHGSAQLLIGKVEAITVKIDDGRIVGEAVGTPQCQVSFSKPQAEALVAGELKLSVGYMRGDLKPTGSTAAILALIDALDAIKPT